MFDRLSRSWNLVQASASVLMADKTLIVFPMISAVATFFVLLCFALPLIGLGALDGMSHGRNGLLASGHALVAFLFYLCNYFVIFFCNSALIAAAMMRLDGKSPTLGDGFAVAASRAGAILGYAAIAATVGMLLRALQERLGWVGQIVAGLLGMGWTLATFLVVPVLVARDVGPIDAVKESASLFKRTWGENVAGQAGLGLGFFFIYLIVVVAGLVLIAGAVAVGNGILVALAVVAMLAGVLVAALTHSALAGIYAAALYRYASNGAQTAGFDNQALQLAFQPRA